MRYVACDECGCAVIPEARETPTDDGGVTMELPCPRCGAVFPVARITAEGVRLRGELQASLRAGDGRAGALRELYEAEVTTLARQ